MTQLPTVPAEQTAVLQAAQRLSEAAARHVPCAPVRDLIGTTDVDLAYAVQKRLTAERTAAGARIVGRKIGLTSPAVQQQLGVDQPDFGVLFDDMECRGTVPMHRLLQPKVEAEIAFVLAEDLEDGPLDLTQVKRAVDYTVAALEIVDSRIARWDISFADTVADNASSGLFVLGERQVSLDSVEPKHTAMELAVDGQVASTGSGAACLGDPLRALAWLAGTARDLGEPLRAGQVVLSGALGPMVPVVSGTEVTARITGLGEVTAQFYAKEEV
jgi:2-keto-4-pentenoate hydratase